MQYIWFNSTDVGGYLLENIFPKIRSNCTLMWKEKWLGHLTLSNMPRPCKLTF